MTDKPSRKELEQKINELNTIVLSYQRTESKQQSQLRFLEIMDNIDGAVRRSEDLDQVLADVLEIVMTSFKCDRIWLMYPCDPDSTFWRVPMERTNPEYPGAFALNRDFPMNSEMGESFKSVLNSKKPLIFHPDHGLPIPDSAREFSIQSSINKALYPKVGKPWMLGMSQCAYAREWTDEEVRIFQEIGRRISDCLSNLLVMRNLKESEEKFRSIFENLMDVYFESNLNGEITSVSPSAEEFSGYAVNELIGKKIGTLYQNPEERDLFLKRLKKNGSVRGYELRFKRKNGEGFDVSVNADIHFNEKNEPTGMAGTARDITLQKKLREQSQRSKKMESLGLMASGIAHDLNNILSGIVSYPDLLLLDIPIESPLRKPVEIIKASGQRAADVVSDLLTVAKGVTTGKEVLNLNTVIEEYLDSGEFKTLKGNHPDIVFELNQDPELMNIFGSSSHMKKILTNLVSNASDAIERKGQIVINTENKYLDEPLRGYENILIGEYALLTVTDTGFGISRKNIERVFEPFYTKKVMGRSGTGLGLAVVWNSVQDHDGYINVESNENGTVFELYFPVTRKEAAQEEEKILAREFQGNGEKILVVDDEDNQREIANTLLSKLGYRVETVSCGEKAVEYLKNNPTDLIVLDMIMNPGINGRETYEKAITIQPKQKAVIVSGLAESDEVIKAQKLGAGIFVKKPYTLEKIGIAVRDELNK